MCKARNRVAVVVAVATAALAGIGAAVAGVGPFPHLPGRDENLPALADTLRIAEWRYLGPFSVGPREGITGIDDRPEVLVPPEARPTEGGAAPAPTRYPSMLVQGGYAEWRTIAPDSSGAVSITFANVLWDSLASVYGAAGVLNITYAWAEFVCAERARALVAADRVGSFYLNGVPFPGNPYGDSFVRIPVVLQAGRNRILVKLSGYGDPAFKLELLPVPAPVITVDDYTTPDLIRGERGNFWVGIPVLNTTAARIDDAVLTIGDGTRVPVVQVPVSNLTALCLRKLPAQVALTAPAEGDTLDVPLEVSWNGTSWRDTLALRVREPGQSAKRTFISAIDGSCQYYAVLPPTDYDPAKSYALILTLHGAGVRAEGQADAYKPKPWTWIVAATNRRPFGFDWQDWGRLDALEVLAQARAACRPDPARIYLTGHSMGGHGVWHVGLAHPDRFAAMGPGAGWTSFDLYIPWFLQKSSIFAEPRQIEPRNVSLREDQPLDFIENLRNVPVFIFQGGADDNVPPVHPRMLASRLDDLGYEYIYKEIPGKGHWWSIDSLGTSCVDDPDLMKFFEARRLETCPRRVTLVTTDLGKTDRSYWIEIGRQAELFRDSRIDAVFTPDTSRSAWDEACGTVAVTCDNVTEFTIRPCDEMLEGRWLEVTVGGKAWRLEARPGESLAFSVRAGEWRRGETRTTGLAKSRDCWGPIKQAYFSPFVLVYGTAGGEAVTDLLLHQARLEALQWWLRGNGFVEIIADSDVTAETAAIYNLILFGGPDENLVTRSITRQLPIEIEGGRCRLGTRQIDGGLLAAKFIYPNPLARDRFVVVHEGAGIEGLRLATSFGALSSAAGLPDYLIFDESVRTRGWAGVKAAGFFGPAWQVE